MTNLKWKEERDLFGEKYVFELNRNQFAKVYFYIENTHLKIKKYGRAELYYNKSIHYYIISTKINEKIRTKIEAEYDKIPIERLAVVVRNVTGAVSGLMKPPKAWKR